MTAVRFSARTRISTLTASACRSPLAVFQDLAARAAAEGSRTARTGGSVLMESAAQGSPGGTRSLVVPAGVVRLIARGRDVSFDALSPQGARLLPALGGLSRFPAAWARRRCRTTNDSECPRFSMRYARSRISSRTKSRKRPCRQVSTARFLTSSSTAGKICLPVPRILGTSQTSTSSSHSIPFSLTTWPGTFTWSRALWIGRRTLSVTSGTNGSSKR